MDFLWHKVSEKEKQEIQEQAKKIMDNFSNKLSKIKETLEEPFVERDSWNREESEGKSDENFSKEIMFKNAKEKDKDFIIGEKKTW
ncbi:MAG: hypothetical protein ABIH28_04020 [archaeon]